MELAREAAEVHRKVRALANKIAKPGIKLIDLCERIEAENRKLVGARGLERGIAFPTGCSINHIAAHFSPNPGDRSVLGPNDVLKIDFGTQIGGIIIDCAWTIAPEKFAPLLDVVKEATNTGIKSAGVDARLGEIGEAIGEVLIGEIEIDGKIQKIHPVRNLSGHDIKPYVIHGGKSIFAYKNDDQTKMYEGEFYAVETFGTTGRGIVSEDYECSHYMKQPNVFAPIRMDSAKRLLHHVNKNYGTLAFCKRFLERDGVKYSGLKQLCDVGIVKAYPPLCDIRGSYVAQFEHTIFIKSSGVEVLSRGDDF